jgi:hypothetical protein
VLVAVLVPVLVPRLVPGLRPFCEQVTGECESAEGQMVPAGRAFGRND